MPAAPTQNSERENGGSPAGRIPRLSLMMGWWSLVSAMFWLYIAGLVASVVGFTNTVIGLVLTVAVYGLVNKALAGYAIDTGFGVERLSQLLFGKVGSVLATLVFAATALYYGVFEGSIIAATLEAYTRDSLGWSMNVWYFIVVAYATPLVFGGVRNWLDKLNGLLLPLYTAGLIAAVIVAAVSGKPAGWTGFGPHASIPFASGGPGWLMAFGIYMGVWILMMYTMDFAQLGRPQDRRFHTTVTFGWVFYSVTFLVNGLVGIFLSHALRSFVGSTVSEGGVAVALTHVMGIWAVLLVFVSQTRINTANYFLASSNLEILGRTVLRLRLPRGVWVVIGSVIMFLIMLTDVFSYILTALNWQGVLVTGWVAIALTHVALDKRQGVDPAQAETRTVRTVSLPGVIGWGAGSLVGLVVLEAGPVWASTWGPILTAVCAAGTYAALRTALGTKGSPVPETDAVTTAP
ncbi:allantoin permease [Streptomyces umbrinus]|uniref:purine-cytosine permease family protein n=1 Tax=Streptomyces umbrinus TaxID=67370 RepID=UPI001678DD4D|nr:permease [Streptomyces umbrinus]GHB87951.1 allantoin permease [Streptomyces umbrinus]